MSQTDDFSSGGPSGVRQRSGQPESGALVFPRGPMGPCAGHVLGRPAAPAAILTREMAFHGGGQHRTPASSGECWKAELLGTPKGSRGDKAHGAQACPSSHSLPFGTRLRGVQLSLTSSNAACSGSSRTGALASPLPRAGAASDHKSTEKPGSQTLAPTAQRGPD